MTNKTSEAVADLPRWAKDMVRTCLVADYGTDTAKALSAIAEKYKRMTDYLEVIHKESNRHFKGDEFTEVNDILRNIYMHASGAIEFDPLNSSSPNSLISSAQ